MGNNAPKINADCVYLPSEKVISREIEGEIIIVPIESGIADIDDALYSLNETGHIIWNLLAQKKTVKDICSTLCDEYAAPPQEIENDVLQLLAELLHFNIIIKV